LTLSKTVKRRPRHRTAWPMKRWHSHNQAPPNNSSLAAAGSPASSRDRICVTGAMGADYSPGVLNMPSLSQTCRQELKRRAFTRCEGP
jgi:hypothetical protein